MSAIFSKATAAFHSRGEPANDTTADDGESLTTILDTEGRAALTILVAGCADAMREGITAAFDAKQLGQISDMIADLPDDKSEPKSRDAADTDAAAAQEREKKEMQQREKELSAPKLQELKAAALAHFDDWRGAVIQRIGEVVNSKDAPQAAKESEETQPESPKVSPMRFPDPPEYDPAVQQTICRLYPPVKSSLTALPERSRALVLHSVLLLLLSLENYQAYSRTLMLRLVTSLNLSVQLLAHDESKVARSLLTAAEHMKADEETEKRAKENQNTRKWKVGLATVAGAALIGVTGGLAAPLLAAGVGSVMGGLGLGATAAAGYLGALAGSGVLVGGLFGAYGGRMTGKMMDQYAREVSDFAFVPVRETHKPRKIEYEFTRLRVAIGVSGWLTSKDDVVEPWKTIGSQQEAFALRWELDALMSLGSAMMAMVKSAAWGYAKTEVLKRTVFASLTAGLWPLGLLKVSRILDNPFSVAHHRAIKAGEVLADALVNKAQGERPVTLIGYSLGAKVIYACLQQLAERRAFGLVESVVLIGAPAPSTAADWRRIRTVVSGRVVNVFSSNDYILGFLYRSSSIQYGVAGLQAVKDVAGVENYDVSDLVSGHNSYRFLAGRILQTIGFEDVDLEETVREEHQLQDAEAEQTREREAAGQDERQKADHEKDGEVVREEQAAPDISKPSDASRRA